MHPLGLILCNSCIVIWIVYGHMNQTSLHLTTYLRISVNMVDYASTTKTNWHVSIVPSVSRLWTAVYVILLASLLSHPAIQASAIILCRLMWYSSCSNLEYALQRKQGQYSESGMCYINSWRAENILGKIKMHMLVLLFINTDMAKVIGMCSGWRQILVHPTYLVQWNLSITTT